MRLETSHPRGFKPLRSEQQVNRQRTAQTTDCDEEVRELGLGGEKFRELVEDDEEGRHWGEAVLASDTVSLIVRDVRVVACVA